MAKMREGSYPVVASSADVRVVAECPAGLQWIIQYRYRDSWHNKGYCRTKSALLRLLGPTALAEDPAVLALPDWFPEEAYRERPQPTGRPN